MADVSFALLVSAWAEGGHHPPEHVSHGVSASGRIISLRQ